MSKKGFSGGTVLSRRGMRPRFRRGSKKGPTTKSLAKKIKKLEADQELSHVDILQAEVALPLTGVFTLLNPVPQGDDDDDRHGDEIISTSIQWRSRFTIDADLLLGTTVRMIIFFDLQANGAAPVAADLLDASIITTLVFAPYNRNNQKRFKIIDDYVTVLNPQAVADFDPATGVTQTVVQQREYYKGKRRITRRVKFDGAGAVIADIVSNSLYCFQVSDTTSQPPTVTTGFRYYFKDP